MPLIKPLTEAEQDLVEMREDVLVVAEATHHLAVTLKTRNERFWSQPLDRLLAVLNNDPESSVEIITKNQDLGFEVNDSLDRLNFQQFPVRVPLRVRSDIRFDGELFVPVDQSVAVDEPA